MEEGMNLEELVTHIASLSVDSAMHIALLIQAVTILIEKVTVLEDKVNTLEEKEKARENKDGYVFLHKNP